MPLTPPSENAENTEHIGLHAWNVCNIHEPASTNPKGTDVQSTGGLVCAHVFAIRANRYTQDAVSQ